MDRNITDFFLKYMSDKSANGYDNVYNDLFYPRKDDSIRLLEIGVGTLNPTHSNMIFWKNVYHDYSPGASLRAFRDYFPNGMIYGVDIQEDCMINDDRIFTYLFDSRSMKMCDHYFHNLQFDFIIDDGDHNYMTQIQTFQNFFRKLTDNGIYILEDLENPDQLLEYFGTSYHDFQYRDNLIIIRK